MSARCFFKKSCASRRLVAIKICKPAQDLLLKPALKALSAGLERKSTWKQCGRAFSTKGCSVKLRAAIFGVVFPILFMLNFVLSVIGEVGLGYEIFGLREDLTAIGHFGEWPINAIEAAVTGPLLYRWHIAADSNLQATKELYRDEIRTIQPDLKPRLTKMAVEELEQGAAISAYLQLPFEDEMDELTNRLEEVL